MLDDEESPEEDGKTSLDEDCTELEEEYVVDDNAGDAIDEDVVPSTFSAPSLAEESTPLSQEARESASTKV